MTDITPLLNQLLKSHDAPPTADPALTLAHIDSFLKEAYEINAGIASLNTELRGIRQSYLSTAAPPRRTVTSSKDKQWKYLTDRQRDQIDAETKQLLRDLNARIRMLSDAELVRQNTEQTIRKKRYARLGLGSLGKWAAGGIGQSKTLEEQLDEAKANAISMHRENVLWYLRQKLQECGTFQASMMEKRILREMEKNKSTLAKSRMENIPKFSFDEPISPQMHASTSKAHLEAQELYPEEELTAEQIQVFEKQNQDMLKHYESTLDQVRTAEKSLIEISELQTQLVNNLATQSAHIDQLVTDSYLTTENVGGGNKELKKASERKSTAKYVFYASCGLSLFLVVWDLVI
ncbi:snare protein syntaxin-like protein 18/UFE1 [Mollisia scopiformis]|uniref:Snare protein syntaxin-like protein 18/UFE1 n=1 Tax=Mollisia scopiformis TaxID=149040 RepID=A0A194X8K5_MOLSC|nr:snare protein syntaxin-like protein 18/UFE1 [Mollisia scopiformis]KUJ16496.1 snare protein syntaxin-like protein 18/UFE1 [Mollisia scopiformis]